MKRYIPFVIAFGMLALIATAAIGRIAGQERAEIVFGRGQVPEGVTWSPTFSLTEEGLVSPEGKENAFYDVWIQTHKIPAGFSWRPPSGAHVALSVHGIAPDGFPIDAYLRYGCDGVHWSTWYYMRESEKPVEESLETYVYDLRLPQVARQSYQELMREWWKTEPDWSSDEDAFCRWVVKKRPDFFAREFPFVGYVQFRLEHWGLQGQVKVKSLSAQISWGVGGKASIPKDDKKVPMGEKWHFDLREVQNE